MRAPETLCKQTKGDGDGASDEDGDGNRDGDGRTRSLEVLLERFKRKSASICACMKFVPDSQSDALDTASSTSVAKSRITSFSIAKQAFGTDGGSDGDGEVDNAGVGVGDGDGGSYRNIRNRLAIASGLSSEGNEESLRC